MTLDLFTVSIMTATVIIVCGVVYISETLIRRDEGSGRLWSVAFLSGIITTIAYAAWAGGTVGWLSIALGNAFFIGATGFLWLGCRAYNHRALGGPYIVVAATMIIGFISVAVHGQGGGAWAGAGVMYIELTVLATFAMLETLRGEMARTRTTIGLAVVFAIEALYTAARALALWVWGPEDPIFQAWFSSVPASFVTVVLVITAAIVTSVLRAGRAGMRTFAVLVEDAEPGRVLSVGQFSHTVRDVLARARDRRMPMVMLSLRIDDLPQIATAFGVDVARELAEALREGVRSAVDPMAIIGEDGSTGVRVCCTMSGGAESRARAAEVSASVFEALRALPNAVIPVVGFGIATSDVFGYDQQALVAAADAAADRSSTSTDVSVVFAEAPVVTGSIPTVRQS